MSDRNSPSPKQTSPDTESDDYINEEYQKLSDRRAELVQQLINNDLTVATAASQLALATIPDPNMDIGDCEDNLWDLWRTILMFLEENPSGAQKVSDLIIAISELPAARTDSGAQLFIDESRRVWEDTPALGWEMREQWNDKSSDELPTDLPAREKAVEYFVARSFVIAALMNYDEERFRYGLHMLWTFREALETPLPSHEVDCFIPGAAKLIEVAGERICSRHYEFESGPLVGRPGKGGPLWGGLYGFCRERWDFWQGRFLELADDARVWSVAREKAREAGFAMEEIGNAVHTNM